MAETITESTIPVSCGIGDCDVQDLTRRLTTIDDTHRRIELFCPGCGSVVSDENQELEEVRAIACGPRGESHVVAGKIWTNVGARNE